jgi:hypothetical protein
MSDLSSVIFFSYPQTSIQQDASANAITDFYVIG